MSFTFTPILSVPQNSASPTGGSSSFTPLGMTPANNNIADIIAANSPQQSFGQKVGGFAKAIVSPVATMIARPIQAAAELAGASDTDVNNATKKLTDGIVAPVPENGADVEKDAGRAVETVALGTGSPAAAGAALGLGNSLEQGHDLFSVHTALQTVLGAGAGKLIDLIGTPIFNAAGKAIGNITPDFLTNLASQGSDAIKSFAAQHDILPDAVSTAINKGADAVDSAVNAPFDATGNAVKNVYQKLTSTSPVDAVNSSIKASMPLADKATRVQALENTLPDTTEGGVKRVGFLGNSEIQPTPEDIARGQTVHPLINGVNDPVKQIPLINQGIKNTSEAVNAFADTQAAPANFEDIHNYIKDNLTPSDTLKKDPGALEAYQRATGDASDIVANALRDAQKASGDASATTSTAPIRQARIALDQQIKSQLGDSAFGTPQYTGIKAAEIDARNLLNSLQKDMVRYPGQLEQLNRYNEALNTLNDKGIEIKPEQITALKEQFGLKSTPESEAAAQKIADAHQTMSRMYDARDNIIDKYQGNVGRNKVQEFIRAHPVLKGVLSTVTRGATEGAVISPFIH